MSEHALKGSAQKKLNAIGIDAICEHIGDGKSLTSIAREADVSIGSLTAWLNADAERSARAREVRADTARLWDEKAEEEIRRATDPFELGIARELAHHYRWRAAKIAPREYGDKLQSEVTGADGAPFAIQIVRFGDKDADDTAT